MRRFKGFGGEKDFSEHIRLLLLACLIGWLGGLASIGFKHMIQGFQSLFWRSSSLLEAAAALPRWQAWLIPVLGAALIAPLIHFGAREAKGHGVPEILEALVLRGGRIRPRVAAVKALASSICIASGGSVGREGPIVQISSALASTCAGIFRVSPRNRRTLVAAGAAAGIGATFNAPIAGALFAVEVLLGEFGVFSFSPIIVASVIATLTSRHITGDFAAFTVPEYTLTSIWEIGPYILLGLVAGLVAILFIKSLYFFEDRFERLRLHPLLRPVLGGLLVGTIGLGLPHVLGVSYESIEACLQNRIGLSLALALVLAKVLATSLTLGSGGSGGIFAPSLFLGAMTGNLIGSIFHGLFPTVMSRPGAFALVGMGAVVAAATHAPITAIIILFELTGDYQIILPLMLASILASFLTVGLHRESIYTMKLKRRGLLLREGREVSILRSLKAADFLSEDTTVFRNTDRLGDIVNQALSGKHHSFQIIDGSGLHIGCLALNDLKRLVLERDILEDVIIAEDLARPGIRIEHEDNLERAMQIFGSTDAAEIAVVREDRFLGVIKRKDVIEAYNHEIMKREAASSLANKLKFTQMTKTFDIGSGYQVMEIDAPAAFTGRSLKQLNLKASDRIDVLVIKRRYPPRTIPIPAADEVIEVGDTLVLAGRESDISRVVSDCTQPDQPER